MKIEFFLIRLFKISAKISIAYFQVLIKYAKRFNSVKSCWKQNILLDSGFKSNDKYKMAKNKVENILVEQHTTSESSSNVFRQQKFAMSCDLMI